MEKIKQGFSYSSLTWNIENESYNDWNKRIANQNIDLYKSKLKALLKIYEHIQLRLPFANIAIKRIYQKKLKNISFYFVENPTILAYLELDENKFRVNIDKNSDEYIYKLRQILKTKNSNLAIDAFITNSFSYKENKTNIDLLSLTTRTTQFILRHLYT
ncbi:MAG: hypothetical protein AB8B52_10215 [Winogradskyella sp.]|uniref:hypothetical protein n=1 Tax=Winogradskyella sp. TaxID=1883156 RepID=UPI00385F1BCA